MKMTMMKETDMVTDRVTVTDMGTDKVIMIYQVITTFRSFV
jgi:hypothetical protein